MKQLSVLPLPLMPVLLAPPPEAAHPATYLRYELAEGSTYTVGCYAPCECPISLPVPVHGFFELRLLESNPLFKTFEVSSILWTVSPTGASDVIGCGTYTAGGE